MVRAYAQGVTGGDLGTCGSCVKQYEAVKKEPVTRRVNLTISVRFDVKMHHSACRLELIVATKVFHID